MYFFDTYAIFEIINGNERYAKFKEYPLRVSVLNIAELYAGLLRDKGIEIAEKWYNKLIFDIIDITPNLIVEAVKFRYYHRKKDISLIDAVGYVLAKQYNLKFLTGDKEFKNMPNVEFVKKTK